MLERYNDVLTVAELQEILGIGRNMETIPKFV